MRRTRRHVLALSSGFLGLSGCLRLSERGSSETSSSVPSTSRPARSTQADDRTTTADERNGSELPISYDWESSSQLRDWDVSADGDAYTEVTDGALHQHVTNCENTSATLTLGEIEGPLVMDISWRVVFGAPWGEKPMLALTIDGSPSLPDEANESRDEGGAFNLVYHHEDHGGHSNRGGSYTLHYSATEGVSGTGIVEIRTVQSDHCDAGDHTDTDLYVDSLSIRR